MKRSAFLLVAFLLIGGGGCPMLQSETEDKPPGTTIEKYLEDNPAIEREDIVAFEALPDGGVKVTLRPILQGAVEKGIAEGLSGAEKGGILGALGGVVVAGLYAAKRLTRRKAGIPSTTTTAIPKPSTTSSAGGS